MGGGEEWEHRLNFSQDLALAAVEHESLPYEQDVLAHRCGLSFRSILLLLLVPYAPFCLFRITPHQLFPLLNLISFFERPPFISETPVSTRVCIHKNVLGAVVFETRYPEHPPPSYDSVFLQRGPESCIINNHPW